MKKLLSFIMLITLTINLFNISVFSVEANELTAEELSQLLCNMIDKSDGLHSSSSGSTAITNRLIVKTDTNEELKENYGATDSVEGYKGIHIFQYDTATATQNAYQNFLHDDIEYVEYDFYIKLTEDSTDSETKISHPLSWNTEVAYVDSAFELIEEKNAECSKVVVAVIDSGIYAEHEYFSTDRIFDGGFARVDEETGKSYPSLDDDLNHGTHVAGIIYDNTMSNVELWSYRVFALWDGAPYSVIWSAFELAISKGADVVNMSLDGKEPSEKDSEGKKFCTTLIQSIENATKNGVIVVAAAGNSGGNADTNIPANCPSVITVAATDERGLPDISYSASGECVDIAAPGTNINSTVPRMWNHLEHDVDAGHIYDPIPSSQYKKCKGTSMATPLVTAAVATLKSINNDITASEAEKIIKETAYIPKNWEDGCYGKNYGTGIVNFYNMVKAVLEPEYSITPTIKVNSDNKFEIIAPEVTNANFYYTIDGSVPTIDNHIKYTEPFNLRNSYKEKLIAVCHENGKLIGKPVIYDLVTEKTKTIFYKWSTNPLLNEDSKMLNCKINDPSVAAVDDEGNITGLSPGDTKITYYMASGKRVICDVNVIYAPWQWIIIILFWGFLWY